MQAVKMKQKELEVHLALVKDVEKGEDVHTSALVAEIYTAFDSYIKMLESRREYLLAYAAETRTANLKQIWGQKEFLEVTLASIKSVLHYSERLCHCTSDTHMLAMSTKASECLENLQKTTWTPESDLKLSPPLAFEGGEEFEASLKAAGNLNQTGAIVSIVKEPNLTRDAQRKEMVIKIGTKFGSLPAVVTIPHVTISYKARYTHGYAVDCTVKYIGDSSWSIGFLPKFDGEYTVSIKANGKILLIHELNISRQPIKQLKYGYDSDTDSD